MQTDTAHNPTPRTSKPELSAKAKAKAKTLNTLKNFDLLPDSGSIRLPVVAALFACSIGTVYRRVKDGLIPEPKKVGNIVTWNVGQIRQALKGESA